MRKWGDVVRRMGLHERVCGNWRPSCENHLYSTEEGGHYKGWTREIHMGYTALMYMCRRSGVRSPWACAGHIGTYVAADKLLGTCC